MFVPVRSNAYTAVDVFGALIGPSMVSVIVETGDIFFMARAQLSLFYTPADGDTDI